MGAYDAWDTYKTLGIHSACARTQGTKTCPKLSNQKPFHELAQQQKDAAADQYKKDAWKVLKTSIQPMDSLNFQAQPHRVCQSCQGFHDRIRHSHSLEENFP